MSKDSGTEDRRTVVCIEDDETGFAVFIQHINPQGDLPFQVSHQVAKVEWCVDADITSIFQLTRLEIPALHKSLSQ